MESESLAKPSFVVEMEQVFGVPSQAAFGSAVFFDPDIKTTNLEEFALSKYKHFCGDTWTRFGEENWLANWTLVQSYDSQSKAQIVDTLRSLEDRDAKQLASMLLDNANSVITLSTAFDAPSVSVLHIYRIGDGNAMSGLLIAGSRPEGAVLLVFLMD